MKSRNQIYFTLCFVLASACAYADVPVYNSNPSAQATIFLDFDGHYVDGTSWNWNGPINCGPSGMGAGEIAWAPIMGVGYYRNQTLWHNGTDAYSCTDLQDDLGVITSATNGFGYRPDDYSDTATSAATASFINNQFTLSGIIETN